MDRRAVLGGDPCLESFLAMVDGGVDLPDRLMEALRAVPAATSASSDVASHGSSNPAYGGESPAPGPFSTLPSPVLLWKVRLVHRGVSG